MVKSNTRNARLNVLKTYKIYIGGKFPRTESGRYYQAKAPDGTLLGNICLSSRKDFREAVLAGRAAFGDWSTRAAFNRSQVLYRLAEMLEGRKAQFVEELVLQGSSKQKAENEVVASIDRLVYYAGWCDKFQQVFSSVNPVASSHFNFTIPEAMGVIAIVAPEESGMLGLISLIASAIAGGNTCIVLASETKPLCAITFAEVLQTSDIPGGVVNILTGSAKELLEHFSNHMDVNAIVYCDGDSSVIKEIKEKSTSNLKRPIIYTKINWDGDKAGSPYFIMALQELKTTWHPIGT